MKIMSMKYIILNDKDLKLLIISLSIYFKIKISDLEIYVNETAKIKSQSKLILRIPKIYRSWCQNDTRNMLLI